MDIITNKQEALDIVTKNGYVIQYVSEELRNDKEVVLVAVKRDIEALGYASKELRNNLVVQLNLNSQQNISIIQKSYTNFKFTNKKK